MLGDGMRRTVRVVALVAILAAAIAVGPASAGAQIPLPDDDPFYVQPDPMPDVPPGTVLASRPVTIKGLGIPLPFIKAWHLLYASTDTAGDPAAAVGTVIVPAFKAQTSPRPLLSYQTAEDSLNMKCAPSYRMRLGIEKEEPLIYSALLKGWVVMVPDYEGLESLFGAGVQAGQATLDGIRAAQSFAPAGLSGAGTPVGLMGYSGGGLATTWAAELEPTYAPALNVKGVAAGGVPGNIENIARNVNGGPFSSLYLAAALGIARAYPELIDLDTLLNEKGKTAAAQISNLCIEQYTIPFAFKNINDYTTVGDPLLLPQVQQVLALNSLGQRTPIGPMYVYHSILDQLIPIADVDALVADYCDEGVTVKYRRDLLSEHIALAATGGPAALQYLTERFAGKPAPSTC